MLKPLIVVVALWSGDSFAAEECFAAARNEYKLGVDAYKASQLDLSKQHYRSAMAGFREINEWYDLAKTYHAYLFVASDEEVDEIFTKGIDLARRLGYEDLEAEFLHARADFLFGQHGDLAKALETLDTAIVLLERNSKPSSLATALISLGRIHRAHGQPDRALTFYERALRIQEDLGRHGDAVQTLNAMGYAYSNLGKPKQALALYQLGLQKALDLKSARHINFIRGALAGAHLDLGHYDDAIALLQQVLAEPITPYLAAWRNYSLATAYFGARRYSDAVTAANAAIEAQSQSIEPILLSRYARAKAKAKLGRDEEALADIDASLKMIEELRAKLVPEDFMKRGFSETYQKVFGLALELQNERGAAAEALQTAESARGRAFLDLLATRTIEPVRGGGLTKRGDTSEPRLRSAVSVDALSAEQMTAAARQLQSTLLVYWVSDDTTFIWVVQPDGNIHSRTAELRKQRLADLVRESWGKNQTSSVRRVLLRSGDTMTIERMDRTAWRELHRHLVEPVREFLPRQRGTLLTIVPHGPLFGLSFAGLLDEEDKYFVESYTVHYAPAVSVLNFITSRRRDREEANGYLLVSNPRFDESLPQLPGSDREVGSIAKLLRDRSATILSGANASEEALRRAVEGKAVLHLATHGIVRDDQTFDSYLALAGRDRLTVQEIYGLNLDADLVVLSACRTALGKVSGDGVAGLTRAFFYAGASSVVSTLWDVADEPTSVLLRDFYQFLAAGSAKSQALRNAQLAMLRRLRAGEVTVATLAGPARIQEHPLFWAAFALQGSP